MRRRDLLVGLAGAAALRSTAAGAQPAAPIVIGFLAVGSPGGDRDRLLDAFRRGLAESGFAEGRNLRIEYRWAGEDRGRLPELASDLVGRGVAVIAAMSGPTVLAAKAATSTIPIVFYAGVDPVESGIVATLSHPGGNITGITAFLNELNPKRIEFLRQLVPDVEVFGLLLNPTNPNAERQSLKATQAASAVHGSLVIAGASSEAELSVAIASLARNAGGMLIGPDPLFGMRDGRIVELAAQHRLPTIYYDRSFVDRGGLISYGASLLDTWRQVGVYAGKVAAGAKPSELPVVQPTKFELVINLKTAKTLGLGVPQALLARADEVIE